MAPVCISANAFLPPPLSPAHRYKQNYIINSLKKTLQINGGLHKPYFHEHMQNLKFS